MPVPQGSGVIHRKSARQAVYETVCDWIITGVLEPGEKILDSELGEYFSVSRTPVREALQLLQSQKLVLVMPGRATVVGYRKMLPASGGSGGARGGACLREADGERLF